MTLRLPVALSVAFVLALPGVATASPALAKLAVHQPRETKPLTMKQAKQAAMRFMRTSAVEEFATNVDVYDCKRRTRYVVDCDGDMLGFSCHHQGGDLFGPCIPGTERKDILTNLMRVRSRLGFQLVRLREP